MSTVVVEPLFHYSPGSRRTPRLPLKSKLTPLSSLNFTRRSRACGASFKVHKFDTPRSLTARASSANTAVVGTSESSDAVFTKTFEIKRPEKVEGNIAIRLDRGKDEETWQLTVGCNLPGKWILHWGVSYVGDIGSEWDQPPPEMRPPGSIPIKDYAIETPMEKASTGLGESFHEATIDINTDGSIAAINFVLKDEKTGAWYQHRGRDFKIPLIDQVDDDRNIVGAKKGFGIWPGGLRYSCNT